MAQFPEMLRIAQQVKSTSLFNPLIYFNLGVRADHPNVLLCLKNQVDVLDYSFGFLSAVAFSNDIRNTPHPQTPIKSLKNYLKNRLPYFFNLIKEVVFFLNRHSSVAVFFYRVLLKTKRKHKEKQFLNAYQICLIVLAEDSEDYFTPQLVHLGHEKNIKSIVFPYTFANRLEFLEDAFLNDRRVNRGLFSFLAGKMYPKWTAVYKGKKLLKSTPALIFSTEFFKISSSDPWVMTSEWVDAIAVESQFMKDYYVKAGLLEKKFYITGYPALDNLAHILSSRDEHRNSLASRYRLDVEKTWLVCAIPPLQWHRSIIDFDNYENFLKEFFSFLKEFENIEILFKFHPRNTPEEIKKICDQYQIQSFAEDTVQLIAVGDIFMASVSSTMRWALAVGLPTINYDMYGYDYGDFDSAQNYYTAFKFQEFKEIFSNILKNRKNFSSAPQLRFGQLDGLAHQRIINLLSQTVGKI